jgi:hypothetical protein
MSTTRSFVQVGHDLVTSAICRHRQRDKQGTLIYEWSSGFGRTEHRTPHLQKALFVVRRKQGSLNQFDMKTAILILIFSHCFHLSKGQDSLFKTIDSKIEFNKRFQGEIPYLRGNADSFRPDVPSFGYQFIKDSVTNFLSEVHYSQTNPNANNIDFYFDSGRLIRANLSFYGSSNSYIFYFDKWLPLNDTTVNGINGQFILQKAKSFLEIYELKRK